MKRCFFTAVLVMVTSYGISQEKSVTTLAIKKVSAKDVRAIMDTSTTP